MLDYVVSSDGVSASLMVNTYAEIKMLATGNPYIKEKMDLDIQVQKLKMLKSNFLSEKYGLEDKVIKFYPQQIAYLKSRVEGLTKDVETAKLHPKPIDEQPLGMMQASSSEGKLSGKRSLSVPSRNTSFQSLSQTISAGF